MKAHLVIPNLQMTSVQSISTYLRLRLDSSKLRAYTYRRIASHGSLLSILLEIVYHSCLLCTKCSVITKGCAHHKNDILIGTTTSNLR